MVKHMIRDIYHPTMSKIWLGNRSTCQIVYVKDFRVTITQLLTTPYPTHKSHPAKNNKKHPLKSTRKRVLCPLASCIFCFISFISSREPTCDLKEHKRKPTVRKYLSNLWLGLIRQPSQCFSLGDMSGFTNQQKNKSNILAILRKKKSDLFGG